ncbi:glycoside hydrolase family 3 protein [Thermophagus sp. OGC60D27]|uniref:glycoside hydrolase family 3 protein n=1 Tax=Thermophagus sp. OGC60D27 TaxID=3458415 RepID=UPI00403778F6
MGIPLFLAEEVQHGHIANGITVFQTGIGLESTWSPTTIEEIGKVISKEIHLQGSHIVYGPVLDLMRDPRWLRVEETYGEDPVLSALMGAAMIRGTSGGNLAGENAVISTLKHFLAYGVPEAGLNGNSVMIGMNELHQNSMPPFKDAVDAGVLSVRTAYNSIYGIPCTSNKYLLTDILRDEWGFNAFVVSDLFSIEGLKGNHFVAETMQEDHLWLWKPELMLTWG